MCYAVRCSVCGKVGWAGCGEHVEEVMKDVAASQRCTCRDRNASAERRAARQL